MPSNNAALHGEKNTDVVHSILVGIPFKIRSDNEKLLILRRGRPLYNINVVKRDSTKNCRTFHSSWYSVHKWLCGSENYNKLFCWPCLLMRPESSSWCSTGCDDLKRFTSLAAKHSRCKSHLKAISEYNEILSTFGLSPEFVDELRCKEEEEDDEDDDEEEDEEEVEEGSISDKTDADEGFNTLYFHNSEETERLGPGTNSSFKVKPTVADSSKGQETPKIRAKITFKSWQEMCKNNFPVSKSSVLEDLQLHKWKRKIAKQELRNARLAGEKLQFEIEVLKAKIDYYKSLKEDTLTNKGFSDSGTLTQVLDC